MRVLPVPAGWVELGRHLCDEHGYAEEAVDAMDSDDLRAHHKAAHRSYGRDHEHEDH